MGTQPGFGWRNLLPVATLIRRKIKLICSYHCDVYGNRISQENIKSDAFSGRGRLCGFLGADEVQSQLKFRTHRAG